MKIIQHIEHLQEEISKAKDNNKSIGFVPTMGALHAGHLSLVKISKNENDICVVSIFINPTQFNNKNDFTSYPRDIEKDCELLRKFECDIVFTPDEKEMYPVPDTRKFDFSPLDKVMEGKYRPGHFNGVGQIVSKLFDAVTPHKAYFGKKDYQQLAIIKKLAQDYNYPVEIIGCETQREPDGLAMSSRNMLLTGKQRKEAPHIYKTLIKLKSKIGTTPVTELKNWVKKEINSSPELQLEYIEIADCKTLAPIEEYKKETPAVACIAVFANNVRLIDNVELNS